MQIVAINPSRNSQQVWLKFDDDSLLPLQIDDLVNLKLTKFSDISLDTYKNILEHSAKYLQLEYCLRQIAISPKIRKILEQKLRIYNLRLTHKYSFSADLLNSLTQTTLSKIDTLGLLDEQVYVDHIIRKYPKKSSFEISYLLRRQGINYTPQPNSAIEISKIKQLISKKFSSVNFSDYNSKNKVLSNLIHRGFALEFIKIAIDEITQLR